MRPIERLLERLEGVRSRSESGWQARCPAHDDENPSLSIREGDDGRALVTCHAGCATEAVISVLGLQMSDLFEHPESNDETHNKTRSRIVETYDYHDPEGQLHFQTVRYEPKEFRQRRPDKEAPGRWIWNLQGTEPVLYRLPEVLKAIETGDSVFVCEGEKDADRLRMLSLTATTAPMGAGKWRESYSEALRGAHVVVIPDHDLAGREHAIKIAQSVKSKAASIKVLDLPNLSDKGDVSDWLDAGGTAEGLERLARESSEWSPARVETEPVGKLLSTVEPEQVSWLWPARIPLGKLTVVDGDPGLGKSAMTTDLAARVSAGRSFPDDTPCGAGGVVILSAEDGLADTIRPRLDAAGGDPSKVLSLATVKDEDGIERLLCFPNDLEIVRRGIERVEAKLVIVDPLMAFVSGNVDAHRDQDMRRVLAPLARLAEGTEAAVVAVRHLTKSSGGNPLYRGGGSIGIVGAARSALLVAKNPQDEDQRVLAPLKCNLASQSRSLAFVLREAANGAVRVEYKGETSLTADALLASVQAPRKRSELDRAMDFLRDALKAGPRHGKVVEKDANDMEISKATLRRAREELGVRSKKEGGLWYWALPEEDQDVHDSNVPEDEHLEHLDLYRIGKPNTKDNQGAHVSTLPVQDARQDAHDEHLEEQEKLSIDKPDSRDDEGQDAQGAHEDGRDRHLDAHRKHTPVVCIHGFARSKGCALCDPEHPFQRERR